MIAELLGVPNADVASLRAWSQAIVRMYEPGPTQEVIDAAVVAAQGVRRLLPAVGRCSARSATRQ
ncbi:MAG: hypothetical protein R2709_06280 [Marmoricola sp.]